jgi:hypothetical protein
VSIEGGEWLPGSSAYIGCLAWSDSPDGDFLRESFATGLVEAQSTVQGRRRFSPDLTTCSDEEPPVVNITT